MKKAWIIAVIGVVLIGGVLVVDSIFPKAPPINCPSGEDVISISISQNNDFVEIGSPINKEVLQNIRNAEPTRKMSVNDYPVVDPYYSIEIETLERSYQYFVYSENSKVYIEIPYEGIYEANQRLLDLVADSYYNLTDLDSLKE